MSLCFDKEEEVALRRGEMVFLRTEIRAKTVNVKEVNKEKVREVVKTPWVII